MIINRSEYVDKVLGCWMGKNIGGTLGAPFEWHRQTNNVSFYTQELGGSPLPNDDLDIQLLWLIALEEQGVELDAKLLGEYWMLYVTPHWSEYGNAKSNMKAGLMPPLSGTVDNPFKDSCGSYIRSEIWACIAPGCPERAARYAYEDAVIDHGSGEGTYAEVFMAALESAAFVEKDLQKLIDIALSYIPAECGVARAVRHVRECRRQGMTWVQAREELLMHFRGELFSWARISPEDEAKGFREGKLGWDVPGNIGLTLVGLLYGEGDLERTVCIAVNCGEDTDCTAATAGAVLGILNGLSSLPARWIEPIGERIVTACLNLGELGSYGHQLPKDIRQLTERVERVAERVIDRFRLPVTIADGPTDIPDDIAVSLMARPEFLELYDCLRGPVYEFDFYRVYVDYGDGPTLRKNEPKTIRLLFENKYKISERLLINWYTPDQAQVLPDRRKSVFLPHGWYLGGRTEVEFQLEAAEVQQVNRFVVEVTVDGRHTVMLVPIVLLNGH